jgi:hypothetical protein
MSESNETVELSCPECGRKAQLRGIVPSVSDTTIKCNRGFQGRDVVSCPALRGALADAVAGAPAWKRLAKRA